MERFVRPFRFEGRGSLCSESVKLGEQCRLVVALFVVGNYSVDSRNLVTASSADKKPTPVKLEQPLI